MMHKPLQTNQFHWNKNSRKFTADISDFGPDFALEVVWSDSCDVGFKLQSSKTGAVVMMVEDNAVYGNEDIVHWVYRPAKYGIWRNQSHLDFEVIIFND